MQEAGTHRHGLLRTDAVSGKFAVGCPMLREARCLDCANF